MPQNQRNSVSHTASTSEVSRPALAIWQTLESERIRWEGQVLIVGQGKDLPALLVITGKRLALIANNEIALEFPLGWMRPEPKLVAENGIRLYISPNGESQISQPMMLRARAGRAAAAEIAAVLTGRTFNSRQQNSPMHIPTWKEQVGAGPSVALPQLNDDATSRTNGQKASWPPAETSGVKARPTQTTPARPRPSADIAPWKVGSSVPQPRPVPTGTSRAARLLGTSSDGFTVSDQPGRAGDAPMAPVNERKHRMPMWLLNLAIVALLVSGFGYVAVDRGFGADDLKTMVPGNVANYLGFGDDNDNGKEIAQAPETVDTNADEDGIKEGGDNRRLAVENTTVTEEPVVTEEPKADAPEADAGEDGLDSIGGPSSLPVTESIFDTTPEATEESTDEAPVETEEPEVTEEATEVVTEEPEVTEEAPVDPTIDPTAVDEETVTPEPTTEPEPTSEPEPTAVPTQTVTLEQPASVGDGEVPNQEFQQGGIRYSIDAVRAGAAIEELPEVNAIDGTWVVLTVTGNNTSTAEQTFDMTGFTLLADGNPIPLDSGTGWVSSLLGFDPAYGDVDSATWAPGEQHQFSLTFRAPANTSSLVLVAGDQQIALDASVTNSVGLRETSADTAPAATVTGTVTEVVDAQTIVVDVDGELITVKYLGVSAPSGETCFAGDARQLNADLVEGKEVTLERQSVDTNARGVWVRDVWVADENGNQILVSQALVSQGAATADVSEPNSRYADWLNSTQQEAENASTGMWSLCGVDD